MKKNATIRITLEPLEYRALVRLTTLEMRGIEQQARFILRKELEIKGLIAPANAQPVITPPAQEPSAPGEVDQITIDEMEK